MKGKVSVFIPTYNEGRVIKDNLRKVMDSMEALHRPYDIWVADDGSTDNTVETVDEFINSLPKDDREIIKVYQGRLNVGRGEVLHNAFQRADGEVICFMDADLSTDLRHLPKLLKEIDEGFDVATGSRWMPESKVERSILRALISHAYNRLLQLSFKSKIRDHQCGFKSFRRDKLFKLLEETGVRKYRRWAWDAELLIRSQLNGYRISEFPVNWKTEGKSSFKYLRDIMDISFYLISLHFRLKREKKSF
jgi:glycosyltransferase involved in cell wall biosynthesis